MSVAGDSEENEMHSLGQSGILVMRNDEHTLEEIKKSFRDTKSNSFKSNIPGDDSEIIFPYSFQDYYDTDKVYKNNDCRLILQQIDEEYEVEKATVRSTQHVSEFAEHSAYQDKSTGDYNDYNDYEHVVKQLQEMTVREGKLNQTISESQIELYETQISLQNMSNGLQSAKKEKMQMKRKIMDSEQLVTNL